MIKSQVEEFWTYQYWTLVAGDRGKNWWPYEGVGYYSSRESATEAAGATNYDRVRVVKIIRSMEFFDPIEKEEQ